MRFVASLLLAGVLVKATPIDNAQHPLSAAGKSAASEIAHIKSAAGRKLHGKFLHITGMWLISP